MTIYVRKRNYALTFWKVPELLEGDTGPLTYFVYGVEKCPDSGKTHYQAYAQFSKAMTYGQIKKLFKDDTIHIEEEYEFSHPQRNIDYCEKGSMSSELFKSLPCPRDHPDFGKDAEVYEFGFVKKDQGKRNDLHAVKEKIKDGYSITEVIESTHKLSYQTLKCAELLYKYVEKQREIMDIDVIWCYGGTESGKSHFAHSHQNWFKPVTDKFWEGYDGHDVVILDELRGDYCTYKRLLQLTDKYPFRVETKGGSRQALYTKIIITTPYHPREFCNRYYDPSDRFDQLLRRITSVKLFERELDCPVEETYMYRCTEVDK